MPVIAINDLTKYYDKIKAVDGISMDIEHGEMFALLGPNGAGKTTTMNIMMGFIFPTSGSVRLFGHDVFRDGKQARQRIGFMPEELGMYDVLTAYEHMDFYGRLFGIPQQAREEKIDELLGLVGLLHRKDSKVREYSHGMRQRLGIAQALINDPDLLVLDEPTSGLDPRASHEVREIIQSLTERNITLFLSSHLLHEVQQICESVAIMDRGRLVRKDTIENLVRETRGKGIHVNITCLNINDDIVKAVKDIQGVRSVNIEGNTLTVLVDDEEVTPDINTAVINAGGRITKMEESTPDLEDIFLELTEDE